MSARTATNRLRALAGVPLYRNAYALLLNTVGTGALGLVFWVAAARVLPSRDVGRGVSTVNTMLFIAGAAQLNLLSFLGRFLPVSGGKARRLVHYAYGASVSAAILFCTIFVVLERVHLVRSPVPASGYGLGAFFLATAAYAVFSLQDGVLTGLRSAHWVPLENVLFGVAKLVLLTLFAALGVHLAIFYSWSLSTAIAVPAVTWLIFRKLIDDPERRPAVGDLPRPRDLVRFFAADYVGSVFMLASYLITPVVVVAEIGTTRGAYFAVVWSLVTSIDLIAFNMGSSLVVEGTIAPERVGNLLSGLIRHQIRIVAPLSLVLLVAAPLVLIPFGAAYAEHSTDLLRLMALALVPRSLIVLAMSVWRIDRRLLPIVIANVTTAAAVLGTATALTRRSGGEPVAAAWLAVQILLCVAYFPGLRRRMSAASV